MKLEIPSSQPKDLATLHRWLLEAFRRSGETYGGHIIRRVTVGTESTRIAHGLNERPLTVFWNQDGVTRVGRAATDDDKFIYLQASTETKVDIMVIPGFSGGGVVVDIADESNFPALPVDVPAAPGWEQFYRRDTGGALVTDDTGAADPTLINATPLYIAGAGPHGTLSYNNALSSSTAPSPIQGGTMADSTICFPHRLPAGALRRFVTGITGNAAGAGAGGFVRFALYANKEGSTNLNLYPGALLYDSGNVTFETLGAKEHLIPGDGLALSPDLYWFVMSMNSAACAVNQQQIPCVPPGNLTRQMGLTVRWGSGEPADNNSTCIGWRHALTFGAFPATFPTSAPVRLLNAPALSDAIPVIYFGYSTAA